MIDKFQIKAVLGFSESSYEKVLDQVGSGSIARIGYDIRPISVEMWNGGDVSNLRKIDPIVGKIVYVSCFLYLQDLLFSAMESMTEYNHRKSIYGGMIWDIIIDKRLN